jgi:hypothetical protein
MFKRNEGLLDRIVRVVLGMVLLPIGLIWWFGGLPGTGSAAGLVAAGLGLLGLLTGISGVCPLYIPFGISTLEKEKEFIAKSKSMMADCCKESSDSRRPNTKQTCRSCSPSVGVTRNQPE